MKLMHIVIPKPKTVLNYEIMEAPQGWYPYSRHNIIDSNGEMHLLFCDEKPPVKESNTKKEA
jgi:hypothetical protein